MPVGTGRPEPERSTPEPASTARGVSWGRIVLPPEHGGWAFLAEPIVLGLLVAPTAAGAWLAVAAMAAFLARQPLKLWSGDRRRGRRYPRTAQAERAFASLATLAAGGLVGAAVTARGPMMLAVGLAAPLAAATLALDLSLRSREALAELLAPLALSALAPAMALAAGWKAAPAFALWVLLAARAIPSILYVRARLRLERGGRANLALALVAQGLAIATAAGLAARGLAPWLGVAAIGLLALRAAWGLSPWRPRWSVKQVGVSEAVAGAITVLAIAIGSRLGL
jgi:hypothetical protein